MKRKLIFALNALTWVVAALAAWVLIPRIWDSYQRQGQRGPAVVLPTLSGATFSSLEIQRRLVIVFWSTDCGPCTLELKRLNTMINDKTITADSVLAIALDRSLDKIRTTVAERNYVFQVAQDERGEVSQAYGVQATPTVVFLAPDHSLEWFSTGISPLLEARAERFLRKDNP
jgi:cytochrome c biogenesis protein CcmG/thiol:disulfide interchange protein DsbE